MKYIYRRKQLPHYKAVRESNSRPSPTPCRCRYSYYDLEALRQDVADYIDFFNNMRPHQKLGMLTPSAAEANFTE